jgi:hypothetical protein
MACDSGMGVFLSDDKSFGICRIHYDLLCRPRSDAVGLHTLEINRHSDVEFFILTQVHHSEARRRFRL